MKKILTIVSVMLAMMILVSCCSDKKPPHRAIYSQTSGHDMQYHIILYEPFSDGGAHSLKCGSWNYIPTHIYTDNLGELRGDEVIWKNLDGQDFPFEERGQASHDIYLNITLNTIEIKGFSYKSGNDTMNSSYKVETSSPDSWGIPIVQGTHLPNEK